MQKDKPKRRALPRITTMQHDPQMTYAAFNFIFPAELTQICAIKFDVIDIPLVQLCNN